MFGLDNISFKSSFDKIAQKFSGFKNSQQQNADTEEVTIFLADSARVNTSVYNVEEYTLSEDDEKESADKEHKYPEYYLANPANNVQTSVVEFNIGGEEFIMEVNNEIIHGVDNDVNPSGNEPRIVMKYGNGINPHDSTEMDFSTKDGVLEDSMQNQNGDCWLLSAINALKYALGDDFIKDIVEYHDGYTIVHLKGGAGDYVVYDDEVKELNDANKVADSRSGEVDYAILEIAIQKYKDDQADGKVISTGGLGNAFVLHDKTNSRQQSTYGGKSSEAIYLLTGKLGKEITDRKKYDEYLNMYMQNDEAELAFYSSDVIYDIEGNEIYDGSGPHAFAIKSVDEGTVTIVNPWDSSKEYVISKDELKAKADTLQYCDLSENNPEVEGLARYDQASIEINGTKYPVEVVYQAGEDIKTITIFDNDSNYGIIIRSNGSKTIVYRNDETGMYDLVYDVDKDFDYKEAFSSGSLKDYVESKTNVKQTKDGGYIEQRYIEGQLLTVKEVDGEGNVTLCTYGSQDPVSEEEIASIASSGVKVLVRKYDKYESDGSHSESEYETNAETGECKLKSFALCLEKGYTICKTEYLDDGIEVYEEYQNKYKDDHYEILYVRKRETRYPDGRRVVETYRQRGIQKRLEYAIIDGEEVLVSSVDYTENKQKH